MNSFSATQPGERYTHPAALRAAIRQGQFDSQTAGIAPQHVQCNLAILPESYANDFLRFCQRNPKPCPLIAVSEPGQPLLPMLGEDIDIRTDIPRYRIFIDGKLDREVTDIMDLWQKDWVSFLIGCSFSFEQSLIEDGIPLRHVQTRKNVAMYRTNIATTAAGPFSGPMVVSMRPMTPAHAIRAISITGRMPGVHGAPVHFGNPAQIGITDLSKPDYGEFAGIEEGEVPVFWACGVTPQSVIEAARPPICVTHAPGHMLVTDLLNSHFTV